MGRDFPVGKFGLRINSLGGMFLTEPDIGTRIQNVFSELSAGQQQVARYIARNLDLCAFQPARAIGEAAGVSEATVIRTAVALGYDGFTELQQEIQQAFVEPRTLSKVSQSVSNLESDRNVFAQSIQLDIRNLRRTLDSLRLEDVQLAVEYLGQAEHILVIGLRSSWSIAHFVAYGLQQMLCNVVLMDSTNSNEPYGALRLAGPDTAVIGIAYPRYARETVNLVRYASQQGAKVIAITDTTVSPLADYADVILCTEVRSLFHIDSIVPAFAVVNALLAGVTQQQRDQVIVNLRRLEKVFAEEDVFCEGSANSPVLQLMASDE